jgi:rhamnose transport system ATP-binding protein
VEGVIHLTDASNGGRAGGATVADAKLPWHVELRGVERHFGRTAALAGVSFGVHRGTVHGLVGENGAGKSTLMRIIAGADVPDAGQVLLDGRPVQYREPKDALGDGTTLIAQDLALVPTRSVLENVMLGAEGGRYGVIPRGRVRARFSALTARSGISLDADALVAQLSLVDQQKVEILRSLTRGARMIVMDEPTARLPSYEAEQLLALVRRLREDGLTILYSSHFLREVLDIADHVTVLREGQHVKTCSAAGETPADLVRAMIGRPLQAAFPARETVAADAPVVLRARNLGRRGAFEDVSFTVRAGEIVGIAGLVGSGRTELLRGIFGAEPVDTGSIEIDGTPRMFRSIRAAIRAGVAMLPEDRKGQGILPGRSIGENVTLPHLGDFRSLGIIRRKAERNAVSAVLDRAAVSREGCQTVGELSGGNQQKLLIARWLMRDPRVFLIDEPTRGVDVASRARIYELIVSLAHNGTAVVVVSSELEEILGLAHRVLVMRRGRVVAEHDGSAVTDEAIMRAAFGEHDVERAVSG